MPQLTREEIEQVSHRLQQTIEVVCGRCEMNCCLQGTMVGKEDARRIAKAAQVSDSFRTRLVEGLRRRGAELRRDLDGLRRAARLLEIRFGGEKQAEVAALTAALDKWEEFCDFLEHRFQPEPNDLIHCLVFSGLRATALRAMRAFPGGETVLSTLAGTGTSFKAGRRGIKADRCLFHVDGCIIPTAKPHKCADFYCSSSPGLIHAVADALSFDEFTLAHFVPLTRSQFLDYLEVELDLGPEFLESKVVVGGTEELPKVAVGVMSRKFEEIRTKTIGGGHLDISVDLPDLKKRRGETALVVHCGSIDAMGIYELSVELVRARGASIHPAVIIFADELKHHSGVEHPLWTSRSLSQPLSAANLVAIVRD